MKYARFDSLLLAGVGTLAVHEIAYFPGSLLTSFGGSGVSHAHIPLLWGAGGAIAVLALAKYIVASLRSRQGRHFVDPLWLGLTIGALYTSQEAAERALSGSPAITLLTQWVLWLGLIAVPLVAFVLARLVRCIVDLATVEQRGSNASAASPLLQAPALVAVGPAVGRLAHTLVRRGPPPRTAF